jgi:hypothetical protein
LSKIPIKTGVLVFPHTAFHFYFPDESSLFLPESFRNLRQICIMEKGDADADIAKGRNFIFQNNTHNFMLTNHFDHLNPC